MFKSNKISSEKIHKIIKCFCEDIPATKTAAIFDLNRKTVDRYYHFLQNIILNKALLDATDYKIPLDDAQSCHDLFTEKEASLQAVCCNKSLILGLVEKGGKVFLVCEKTVEQRVLDYLLKKTSHLTHDTYLSFPERWQNYNAMIINCELFTRKFLKNPKKMPTNLSQLFWTYVRRRFIIFNGVATHHYGVFLKNSEFRFNHRKEDLYMIILKALKEDSLALGVL